MKRSFLALILIFLLLVLLVISTSYPPHAHAENITIDLDLPEGWSMISLPVIPDNDSLSSLFPGAEVVYMYEKDVGYVRVKGDEDLQIGKGYWILLNEAKIFHISGGRIDPYNIPVQNRWYMIGGCTSAAQISINIGNIEVIYKYVQGIGYQRVLGSENLLPGKGYWILLNNTDEQSLLKVESIAEPIVCTDIDGDGFAIEGDICGAIDCVDTDPNVNPDSPEICNNNIDDNCNGQKDEGFDIDEDGMTTCEGDCDDSDPNVYLGATEICGDNIDQDCDGKDSNCCTDADEDGFSAEGGDCGPRDCIDSDPNINPGARENCEDDIDQDCNGEDLPCILNDADGDLWSAVQGDCDDNNSDIFPGARDFPGNGIDEDCDGQDDVSPRVVDMDVDGVTAEDGDCHDQNPQAYPGAYEIPCNGIDEDCDGIDLCNLIPAVEPESAYINGVVYNARTEEPLEGATIKLANVGQVQTDTEGKFSIPTPDEGIYLVLIEKEGFTYAQRRIRVESGHDFAVESVYLVPIDPVTVTITHGAGGTLINSKNDVELHFEPGSVAESVDVSATRFYDNRELPGDLPPTSHFTTAVELLPDGITFSKPVRLLVENTYDFAPGTPVPVGYYRKDLGMWVPDGMGKITDDGKYMEYYINHFSPVDLNFPAEPDPNAKSPTGENTDNDTDQANEPKPCNKAGVKGQSKVVYRDGELMEQYNLPPYKTLGKSNSLSLIYTSNSVYPNSLLSLKYEIDSAQMSIPEKVEYEIDIAGKKEKGIYIGKEGEINLKYLFNGINFRAEQLPTGSYPYSINLKNWYPGYYNLARRFGEPGFRYALDSRGNPIRGPNFSLNKTFQGEIIINNQINSIFGSGWNITDLFRIYHSSYKDEILLISGSDSRLFFEGIYREIETIAGGEDGAPATKISLGSPSSVAVDGTGNIYIADILNDRILLMDSTGSITTIAGTGSRGYTGDGGPAIQAKLAYPSGLAVDDSGNIYIADRNNNRIRRIDPNGIITTIAGNRLSGNSGDGGPSVEAMLYEPCGVFLDNTGNIYIADSGRHCIRRIDQNGIITTIAGTGSSGYTGDGGLAINATLSYPCSITADEAGNIYIADTLNNCIRRIDQNSIITTVAGRGGNLCPVSCWATEAKLERPYSIEADEYGNIFIANTDYNNIKYLDTSKGKIYHIGGSVRGDSGYSSGGTILIAQFDEPRGIALDGVGNLYIADTDNHYIRRASLNYYSFATLSNSRITNIAGNGYSSSTGDGLPATQARLNYPTYIAEDEFGNVYIADSENNRIRCINLNGIISTIAGTGQKGYSGDGGFATKAQLNYPSGLAVDDSGNIYIADKNNNRIRLIDPKGIITTIAGNGSYGYSGDGGIALQARLAKPSGIEVDSARNIYIADTYNHRIRLINPTGIITTIAGSGSTGSGQGAYAGDGAPATQARLNGPTCVKVDDSGNIYIADTLNNCIRYIKTSGIIYTIAGDGTPGYSGDNGPAVYAMLNKPYGIALDEASNIYIADTENHRIRCIEPNGIIKTFAGNGTPVYSGDGGPAFQIALYSPSAVIVMEKAKKIYFADSGNHRIRAIKKALGSSKFISPKGDYSELNHNEDGTYTRILKDGSKYHFNSKGQQTSKVDTNGQTTTYSYNENDRLISITDPAGLITTFTYTGNNISSINNPAGRTTQFIHDNENNLTNIIAPDGSTTSFTYDSLHLMTSKTDPLEHTTQYNYNIHGMIENVVLPDDSIHQYSPSENIGLINDLPAGEGTYNNPSIALPPQEDYHKDPEGNETYVKTDKYGRLLSEKDALGNITTYERDTESGNVNAIHYPNGATIQKEYDDVGNLISYTDGEGNTTSYTYETTFNKIKTITDPLGRVTTFDYDEKGNLIKITDALNKTITMTYYDNGLINTITNQNDAITSYDYDSSGNLIKKTDDLGNETTYTYDSAGNMTSIINALGHTTTYTYDVMNNLTGITDPEGGHTSYTYDDVGNRTSMTDPKGNTTQYEYNKKDRLIKKIDPLGNEITYTYDKNGNVITKKDAKEATTTYEYDALGRLIKETDPLDNETNYTYDSMGNRTSITDARENIRYYEYDLNNQTIKIIDPLSNEILFAYDENGNLTSITDANEHITSFAYDKLNRKVSMTTHLGEKELYDYYDNGNLKQKILFNNETINYEYDKLDRMTKKILSTGRTTIYDYDRVGNTTEITNPYSSLSFIYDKNNRLITASTTETPYQPETTITYSYDSIGNRLSMTDPFDGVTSYTYDERNNLSTIINPNNQTTSFEYDGNNQRISKILPSNLSSVYDYNLNGDLISLNHSLETTIISSYSYEYDSVGNRTRMTNPTGDHDYDYDQLNQLTQAEHPQISPESYTYDPVGNRLSSTSSTNWSYDESNKLLDDETFTYQYTNGCLTQKTNNFTSEVTTYTYNSENQLIGITTPTDTIQYYYDGLGRRICKEINGVKTYYIYDDEDILFTMDDSLNMISYYTHGPGVDEPLQMDQGGVSYYYIRDGLGSITKIVDSSGNVLNEYTYDSFGNIVNQTGIIDNPYTYTGREYDPESGLYYYRARYYDPQTGRFLTPDPLGFAGGDINLYAYVNNNPVNWIDPWGLCVKDGQEDPYIRDGIIYDRNGNKIGYAILLNPGQSLESGDFYIKNGVIYDRDGKIIGEFELEDPNPFLDPVNWIAGALAGPVHGVSQAGPWMGKVAVHGPHAGGPHQYRHLQIMIRTGKHITKHIRIPLGF